MPKAGGTSHTQTIRILITVAAVPLFCMCVLGQQDTAAFVGPIAWDRVVASASEGQNQSPLLNHESTRPLGGTDARRVVEASKPVVRSAAESKSGGGLGVIRTMLALGGVLAAAVLIAAVIKRVAKTSGGLMNSLGAGGRAPCGILSVLGRYPVSRGVTLVLLKVDRRVLLICQTQSRRSGSVMSTLCEISDPEEVASILTKARDEADESISRRFEGILSKFSDEVNQAEHTSGRQFAEQTDTDTERKNPFATLRHRVASWKGGAA